MKTLFNLSLICLFLFSINESFAQFTPYTASEGEDTAINYSVTQFGYAQPQLIAVATSNQDFMFDLGGIPLTITAGMNMSDGKSEAWVYVINEKGSDELKLIGVANTFLGFQAIDLTENLKGLLPDLSIIEVNENWINSDDLVDNIKMNFDYQGFINANPESEPQTVGLYVNTDIPDIELNQTYWITTFGEDENFICFTNAINGTTECDVITSVKAIEHITNSIAPNPATNSINLNFANTSKVLLSVSLFDNFGNKVFETKDPQITNIDLTNMATGSYSLIYEYENRFEIEKLIIKK